MAEVTRVRCPICGMMPTLKNLADTAEKKPAQVRIFIQRIGGKKPVEMVPGEIPKKTKKGGAPGNIDYEDITEKVPKEVQTMMAFFDKRIEEYQEGKGG